MSNPILKILGAGDTVASPIEAVGNVLDKLFTSKDEKLTAEQVKIRLLQAPTMAQNEINKLEATHRSIFVAGWRPFIGWVCGSALLYNYILRDILAWVFLNTGAHITTPPDLAMGELNTILLGLLGLGAMRTAEKFKKVTK